MNILLSNIEVYTDIDIIKVILDFTGLRWLIISIILEILHAGWQILEHSLVNKKL